MKRNQTGGPRLFRPAEVARKLGCSEWWVKEQARRRRIPYAWIGGSYRFTEAHVAEIVVLFEVRPGEPEREAQSRRPAPRQRQAEPSDTSAVPLRARAPRRAREVARRSPDAA